MIIAWKHVSSEMTNDMRCCVQGKNKKFLAFIELFLNKLLKLQYSKGQRKGNL